MNGESIVFSNICELGCMEKPEFLPTGKPTLVPEPSRSCLSSSGTEKSLKKASTSSLSHCKQTTAFKALLLKDAAARV